MSEKRPKDGGAAAASAFMQDLNAKADRLRIVRKELATREERYKRETESLFAEQAQLKAAVLQGLKLVNLASVKVRGGDTYFISRRIAFEILNPIKMTAWAIKERIVRVDREMLQARLQDISKNSPRRLPSFVEKKEIETISVRHDAKPEKK